MTPAVLDDTLVIVTSDHGHMNGHHGLVGKANATLPQNLYDEVVRVPLVMRWPGKIPAGERSDLFVDHIDLFATILDAAGVELDEATRAPDLEPRAEAFCSVLDGSSRRVAALPFRRARQRPHGGG